MVVTDACLLQGMALWDKLVVFMSVIPRKFPSSLESLSLLLSQLG